MKKSLLTTLLIWIIAGGVYYFGLRNRIEPPADWIAALVGSFLAMLGIGCLRNARLALIDRKLLKTSKTSNFPQSKKPFAVSGNIYASGDPVLSPFTKEESVLFSYDIYHEEYVSRRNSDGRTTKERVTKTIMSGHELTPCSIRTSLGNVRLLCYPTLEGFPENIIEPENALPNAESFIKQTVFEDMSGFQVTKAFSEVKDLFSDDDGMVSKHLQMQEDYDLSTLKFKEQIVRHGEEVCVVGCFEPQKMGFVPDFLTGSGICRLYRGGPEKALKKIRSKLLWFILGAIFFLGVGNTVLFFVLQQYKESSSQVVEPT